MFTLCLTSPRLCYINEMFAYFAKCLRKNKKIWRTNYPDLFQIRGLRSLKGTKITSIRVRDHSGEIHLLHIINLLGTNMYFSRESSFEKFSFVFSLFLQFFVTLAPLIAKLKTRSKRSKRSERLKRLNPQNFKKKRDENKVFVSNKLTDSTYRLMHERLLVNDVGCGLAPDVVRFGAVVGAAAVVAAAAAAADSVDVDGVVDSADAVA